MLPLLAQLRDHLHRAANVVGDALTIIESHPRTIHTVPAIVASVNELTGILYRLAQIHKTLCLFERRPPANAHPLIALYDQLQSILLTAESHRHAFPASTPTDDLPQTTPHDSNHDSNNDSNNDSDNDAFNDPDNNAGTSSGPASPPAAISNPDSSMNSPSFINSQSSFNSSSRRILSHAPLPTIPGLTSPRIAPILPLQPANEPYPPNREPQTANREPSPANREPDLPNRLSRIRAISPLPGFLDPARLAAACRHTQAYLSALITDHRHRITTAFHRLLRTEFHIFSPLPPFVPLPADSS